MVAAFRYFDSALDMKIDCATLRRAICNLGVDVSKRQLERLLGAGITDTDKETRARRVMYKSLL